MYTSKVSLSKFGKVFVIMLILIPASSRRSFADRNITYLFQGPSWFAALFVLACSKVLNKHLFILLKNQEKCLIKQRLDASAQEENE